VPRDRFLARHRPAAGLCQVEKLRPRAQQLTAPPPLALPKTRN